MRKNLESQLINKFRKAYLKLFPNCFFYKIPDTLDLGGKKPFDVFIVCNKNLFCLEFKSGNKKPDLYQSECLKRISDNGMESFFINEDNYSFLLDYISKVSQGYFKK